MIVKGPAERAALARRGAGRRGRPRPADAAPTARWGLAARGALVEAGGPPLGGRPGPTAIASGPTWRRGSTPTAAAASGTRRPPSTGRPPSRLPAEVEARRRPGDDLPGRERAGRPDRPGAAPRPDPPALPRGHAAARRPGRRRGAAHRGLHPPRAAAPAASSASRAPAGGPRCRPCSTSPTSPLASFLLSVLGEGTFLDLLRFLNALRARPGHRATSTRLALRDEARHVAFGVAHTAHAARSTRRSCARLRAGGRAAARGPARHRRPERRGLRRARDPARGRLWAPGAIAAAGSAVQQLQRDMDEGRRRRLARSASRTTRRLSCPPCTPATSCDPWAAGRQQPGPGQPPPCHLRNATPEVLTSRFVSRCPRPGKTGSKDPRRRLTWHAMRRTYPTPGKACWAPNQVVPTSSAPRRVAPTSSAPRRRHRRARPGRGWYRRARPGGRWHRRAAPAGPLRANGPAADPFRVAVRPWKAAGAEDPVRGLLGVTDTDDEPGLRPRSRSGPGPGGWGR